MTTRKSHSKSRKGCQTCKQRHVKCDEQRPICVNCASRKTTCSYESLSITSSHRADTPGTNPTPSSLQQSEDVWQYQPANSARSIELTAMHRWCTSTYKDLCSVPGDEQLWQREAVKAGLKYDFLLNGVLAFAALDITLAPNTSPDQSQAFLQAALNYYADASSAFRLELADVNEQNHLAIFLFSLLVLVINLVIPKCEPRPNGDSNMLNHVLNMFELLHGICDISATCWQWLRSGPIVIPPELSQDPMWYIDGNTTMAMSRLRAINKDLSRTVPPSRQAAASSTPDEALFETAIMQLELCFAREAEGSIKMFYITWPEMCTKSFSSAMTSSHPMALLLLMHWGVLLSKTGPATWWASSSGKDLVAELYEKLRHLHPEVSEWQASISWARREAGLGAVEP